MHRGIRSGKMTLVMLRATVNVSRRESLPRWKWYAPIIPCLKRLFRNKEHAKLLRWHKEDRKVDDMLRHPADGYQWRAIDREFPRFVDDVRNLRFALSMDGMNPFGEQSSSHSLQRRSSIAEHNQY